MTCQALEAHRKVFMEWDFLFAGDSQYESPSESESELLMRSTLIQRS